MATTKKDVIVKALERGPVTNKQLVKISKSTDGAVRWFLSAQRDVYGIQTIKPYSGPVQHFIGDFR